MNSFAYTRADGVTHAVAERADESTAAFIAGGTNLIDLMKENVARPTRLIDINRLPLTTITDTENGGLRLGALVTNADTAYDDKVAKNYPLLAEAILAGASAQLRNMATDGGNLMQRTRCYYFYDLATPCNKREPGSGCSAINGYNRIHAILGTGSPTGDVQCIATHPSDMCVALAALEATVQVTGPDGDRTIPFAEFHRLPGDTPQIDNTLEAGELITAIDLPANGFSKNYAYLKLRDRASYAFALVSVAAALEMEGETIVDARIALGGVAHKPWRRPEVEAMLHGKSASNDVFQTVADAMLDGAQGYGHNTFKLELAKRAIVRALAQAAKLN
ncbi:FAD binding domain-containing protein [Spirosoma luteum]|uniref:FAD binding domain-containing protein n=1 Tax=Spirosoma luteum TaxID=431553 RepID=UPI0003664B2B|nr:xanthine dehydrogenase family protein subunit M [Spirosoma luteum]